MMHTRAVRSRQRGHLMPGLIGGVDLVHRKSYGVHRKSYG
jgi:hypothetical protein